MDKICFEKPTFYMYLFILICVISYLAYFKYSQTKEPMSQNFDPYVNMSKNDLHTKILELKETLYNIQLREQKCQIELNSIKQNITNQSIQNKFLDKIFNPLSPPENIYPSGNFNTRGYDGYQQYQMIGYISGPQGQFPIYGRYKYPNRTDRMEYYTINDSRGRIKIPFKTKNDNELYDGDSVSLSQLGGEYIFTKYTDEGLRYNPNIV